MKSDLAMENMENMKKSGREVSMKPPWPRVKLGDVCEIILGGTPKTSIDEYWGGNIPWLTPGEMGKIAGPYVKDTKRKLTKLGLGRGGSLFPARSVILSTRAPIGYVFINEVPMCTNQGCKTLIPSEDVYSEYLYYNLLGRTDELNDLGTGTTFKELATGVLKNITIPLPPLPVQREIVARLERELGVVEKVAKKFEELEGAAEAEFKATLKEAFDEISRGGAETRRLGEVCELKAGGDKPSHFSRFRTAEYSVPVIANGIENEGVCGYTDKPTIFSKCVTVSARGTIGWACIRREPFVPIVRLIVAKPYNCIYLGFLALYFQQMPIEHSGASIPQLTVPMIRDLSLPLPSLPVQREIVSRLDAARERRDGLIAAAKKGREAAALWRKAILKEAFE